MKMSEFMNYDNS